MKLKNFIDNKSNLFLENRLLKLGFWILLFVNLLSLYRTENALKYQKTILVPILPMESMSVSGNVLGDGYIRQITRYAAMLAMNYTQSTAQGNFDALLKLHSTRTFDKAQANYRKLVKKIKLNKVTQSFYQTSKIEIDQKTQTIFFEGVIDRRINGRSIKHKTMPFGLSYEVIDGRFYILEMFTREK